MREDDDDPDIVLPENLNDQIDYEFMFHTHPPTPLPGSRAKQGILYEFPSVDDLFHFIEHFNDGLTQGSIIIAPEGLYIIKAKKDTNKITISRAEEKKIYNELNFIMFNINNKAIKKYGDNIDQSLFYSKISQDKTYIKSLNNSINNLFKKQIKIIYKPRSYDKKIKKWILNDLYLSVAVIEPSN